MSFSEVRTLLLFADTSDTLSYFDDWKEAFLAAEEFDVTPVNILNKTDMKSLGKRIKEYEFIVLLHSVTAEGLRYMKPYENMLTERKGKILVFVGNEVNIPSESMSDKIDFIRCIEAEFIGTQLPIEAGEWLFKECEKSQVFPIPHALNQKVFKPLISQKNRKIDIGTRSYRYIPHFGDAERVKLFNFFLDNKFEPPLVQDISTASRFNRNGWSYFLNRCKATISTEAGTYYLERDDKTVRDIQRYIEIKARANGLYPVPFNPGVKICWSILPHMVREQIKRLLRKIRIINKDEACYFVNCDEISNIFFKNYKRPDFYSKCISSRHFDAIGTKTCQIMFEGKFNGILKADEHYMALKHDFSNIEHVMRRFHDISYRRSMVERTYDYIMESHTYTHRIKYIESIFRKRH